MFPARATLALTLAAAAGCAPVPTVPPGPPRNVVLITIDTLRADRLGRGVSPELDAFAASGAMFTHARTTVPLTLPAHTSLLTGRLPPAHGVRLNGQVLGNDVPTLGTALKGAGYRTAAFVGAYVLDRRFGLARGFDVYDDRVPRQPQATDVLEASRPANDVVDAALRWLEQPSGAPFLLWVHLYDPHAPYAPPEPYRTTFAGRPYDGEIAFAGAQAGRLLTYLETRGLTSSTIVVLAGDHGEGLGEHGEATHGMLAYDSTLRVPLVIRTPGVQPGVVAAPMSLADVAGGVLAGSGASATLPGVTTTPGAPSETDEVYAETTYPAVAGWHPLYVLAGPRRKLIRSATLEYYDVAADAAEVTNLAATDTAAARAAVARLSPLMTVTRQAAAPSAEAMTRLRALGYASGPSASATREDGPNPATATDAWSRFETAAATPATEVATLAALAAAHPDGYVFVTGYARALASRGRQAEAMRVLTDAIARFPTEPSLFHDLAVAARATGQVDEALRAEQASLALDDTNAAAQHGLGLLLMDAGRGGEALGPLTRATEIDESNAGYWADLGNAHRDAGDVRAADVAYGRALQLDGRHADAANGRGVLLVQSGRPAEAIGWFERALAAAPDLHEARLNLGIAYQQSGRRDLALATFRDVLRLAPRAMTRERQAATELLRALR